jgi:hypothetical protein
VIAIAASPTGAGLVLTDLQQWKNTLAATLPGGDGAIERVGDMFRITIQWTDSLGLQTFATRTRI